MSSFKGKQQKHVAKLRNKGAMLAKCKYCKYGPISTKGECPNCSLLQHQVSPQAAMRSQKKFKRMITRVMALTLKGKASRWQMFEQRTLPYLRGYNCVKYLGVDGRNMESVYEAAASLFPEEKEKSFFERILKNREKYAGSTGCYLSHMMLWKYAMDTRTQGEEFVLVLEDDAKFEPYGIQNMERIMHELQDAEFDILYLGHSPHLKGTRITPLLLRPPSKSQPAFRTNCGFWGYVIRLASVPNLINSVSSFQDQSVDETIQRQYGELVDALFLISPIVTQSSLYSVRVTMDQGKALR